MFTGIVEEIGKIKAIKKGKNSARLVINAKKVLEDVKLGDSIAVNGVCLTVTEFSNSAFGVDVMHESLRKSSLSTLKNDSSVNLERAMLLNGRFGGHIVSGHIDGTGKIINIKNDDNAIWYTISAKDKIMKYIIEKGSITIDGISLTVANLSESDFSVSIIPHTQEETILKMKKIGDIVNLENDCIAKYVESLLNFKEKSEVKKDITMDFLLENGF
ncbi:riboflavin synthase subunit alpha [Peptostreptococcus russellii]|uniref:Riboflavin synthase n=1 Tax=Peptostreptococcus russellii TaxID=215200 RepID=A0A2P7PYS8_9FIRM|nr:riboflavin synthase [Peptostreptococcus russellii]PSJ30866.1 riboflavin synthase subunit alpha [Peptostreptococcus russellii]